MWRLNLMPEDNRDYGWFPLIFFLSFCLMALGVLIWGVDAKRQMDHDAAQSKRTKGW